MKANIYIDNGKTVKHISCSSKVANAIVTLLNEMGDNVVSSETHEGYCVSIKEREHEWE